MNQPTWPYPACIITHTNTQPPSSSTNLSGPLERKRKCLEKARLPSLPLCHEYNNNSFFTTRAAPSSPTHPHRATLPYSHLTPQLQERLHFLWEPLGGSLISLAFNPLLLPSPPRTWLTSDPARSWGKAKWARDALFSPRLPVRALLEILQGTQSAATGTKSPGNELRGPL